MPETCMIGKTKNQDVEISPNYVQTSLAAALTLGFQKGLFYRNAKLRGLNLLMTYQEGCSARCAYCGLSKTRKGEKTKKTFIRVNWPIYHIDDIIDAVNKKEHSLERVCVGMITHRRAFQDTLTTVQRFKQETNLDVSVLISPTVLSFGMLWELKKAGADMCGVAIDCATPELFEKYRGKSVKGPHDWKKYWIMVNEAVNVFGAVNTGVHLIAGLGETEKEMIETIQEAHNIGARTHLFSFFPEKGSALEDKYPPSLGHYRRIQLAAYLINNDLITAETIIFNNMEQVIDFGISNDLLERIINEGTAFMTSGCTGKSGCVACNRPYGNERPSQAIRNFPFQPDASDIEEIRLQIWTY